MRVYGKTAVVTGLSTIKGTYQKKDISGKYRFIDVFVKKKKKSEWKVVATQVTAITAAH